MTTKQAISFFGGVYKLAEALKISPPAVYQWGDRPPMLRQFEIERKTGGILTADKETD